MNRLKRFIVVSFLISNIGSFFDLFGNLFIATRYISMLMIVCLYIWKLHNVKKNKSRLYFSMIYIITFFMYPLFGILFSYYTYETSVILINACYYVGFLISCLFIADFYNSNENYNFYKDFAISSFLFLLVGSILYRDISFNLSLLINNLISNSRIERSYIGFTNPNQVAIVASILLICTYLSSFNKYIKSIMYVFSFIVLINTGSRTPLLSFLLVLVFFVSFNFYKKIPNNYVKLIVNTIIIGSIFLLFLVLIDFLFSASDNFYTALDRLATNRFSRQLNTVKYVINSGDLVFGFGMFNISFFSSSSAFRGLNTDSYYTYSLITTGVIGVILNLSLITQMLFKALIKLNKSLLGIVLFCACYAAFEATLFFPTSLLTLLLLISFLSEPKINSTQNI